MLVRGGGKGGSGGAHSLVHKAGRGLRTVDVVYLEVECLCLIDDESLFGVGERLGSGGEVGVFGVIEDGHRTYAAYLYAVAAVFDVALKFAVAVCNDYVFAVKG